MDNNNDETCESERNGGREWGRGRTGFDFFYY